MKESLWCKYMKSLQMLHTGSGPSHLSGPICVYCSGTGCAWGQGLQVVILCNEYKLWSVLQRTRRGKSVRRMGSVMSTRLESIILDSPGTFLKSIMPGSELRKYLVGLMLEAHRITFSSYSWDFVYPRMGKWRTNTIRRNLYTLVFPHGCPSSCHILCCCSCPGCGKRSWKCRDCW